MLFSLWSIYYVKAFATAIRNESKHLFSPFEPDNAMHENMFYDRKHIIWIWSTWPNYGTPVLDETSFKSQLLSEFLQS